jgi:phospholipid/cholesterol/gamma-HCH transport system substrate-binding protein
MARKVLVGMLLLGALFIFGLATFYVENWQFYLGKGYRLRAEFPIAQTLDKGDTVRLAGVPVGTVENLEVRTEVDTLYPVEAVLWIRSGVTIRADDTAMIKMSTLFGGNYVAIERGDPGAALLTNNEYISKTSVAPSITQVIEQSTETLSKISGAFEEISRITKDLTEGKGTLARLLKEEDFYNELQSTVAEARDAATGLKASAQRLEQGEGVLGKLLMDDEMAQDFETLTADAGELASNLRAVSADLQNGRGTLGRLMQDEELYEKLSDSVGTIGDAAKTLREGEGILPRLLQD